MVCNCPFCIYGTFGQNVQKWKGERNEVFTAQAVCSTLTGLQLQKIKEENHAGGSYTENDCPCFQVLKADRRCTEKSHEDVSEAPESRTTGNAWKNVSEKAGRSGYGSFEY